MTNLLNTRATQADQAAAPTASVAVRARGLVKTYGTGPAAVKALDGADLDIRTGTFTAIMGPSGSGKSTLMHALAGLDVLDAGQVLIGDTDLTALGERQRTLLRRDRFGFVFQSFNLLPALTAQENITLPLDLAGRRADPNWMARLVDTLGLRERLHHRPSELSGGQQQRVAVARALVTRPEIVFADEPTGNLDTRHGQALLRFLRDACDDLGQTIVMVTHDPLAAAHADRVVLLTDGRVIEEITDPTASAIADRMLQLDTDEHPHPDANPDPHAGSDFGSGSIQEG
ncbi:ABC transporter ATP-binding protein [Nocardioides sp. zg-1230]|uniref:ABC transporter ATP-binding protein n=1 Tax=Nocardioides sp. zg-1230 TaxID=2736601 RepID=UPI00155792D3|nr:ABC transporter ATP-binding protein [Nocardioides sp. zg-1230]NPC44389.1 ABC transporter ATP-binding protein [Nocardioides sp. zg-1230]